jgi:hypothetical protein
VQPLPSSQSRSSPSATVVVPNVRHVRSAVASDMTRTQATTVSPAFEGRLCERQDRQPGHGSRPSCFSPLPSPPARGLAKIKANKRAPETSLSPDTNRGHQGAPGPTRNRALGTSEKPTSAPTAGQASHAATAAGSFIYPGRAMPGPNSQLQYHGGGSI